jgi:hypothetical protein
MNVEIGTEAALFPEKEYIKRIFVALKVGGSLLRRPRNRFPSWRNRFPGIDSWDNLTMKEYRAGE